jgi:hypothetical protein
MLKVANNPTNDNYLLKLVAFSVLTGSNTVPGHF